uniref:CSON008022 protein n=1 Tax=Culicoides sonorensis TaxID=179676 RepID=A0A336MV13_CULSO
MSSEIDNNLSSSANNLSSSVILKEEFDENFEPTKEEIRDYAIKIGIRPDEPHLLHLARDGLMRALPSDWKPCFDEKHNAYYYVNKTSKKTQWEHPLDAEYKLLVEKARRKHQDLSDTLSEIDSGIRSLQGNEESETGTNQKTPDMKVEQTIFGPPRPGLLPITGRDRIQLQPLEMGPGSLRPVSAISRKVGKFEVTQSNLNSAPTKIDLTIKTGHHVGSHDSGKPPFPNFANSMSNRSAVETSPKKGFTLTGGGSLFLKSNTRRQSDVTPTSSTLPNTSKPIDIAEGRNKDIYGTSPNIMKGILRDSSLTDVRARPTPSEMKIGGLDFETTTDGDRKIVRFNLNPAEMRSNSEEKDGEDKEKSDYSSEEEQSVEEEEEDVWDFINNETAGQSGNHVKQVKVTPAISPISPITQLAILKSGKLANETIKKTTVKAMTKNDIKDSKPSIFSLFEKGSENNPKDLSRTQLVKPLYDESESESSGQVSKETEEKLFETFEKELNQASNYQELENMLEDEKKKFKELLDMKLQKLQQQHTNAMEKELMNEEIKFKELLATKRKSIEEQHLQDVLKCKKEAESKLSEIKSGLKQQDEEEIEKFREKLQTEFEAKRKQISEEYRVAAETLQKNHNELLEELDRDLKLEQEIIKKEHSQKLAQMRSQVEHEIEMERQRLRDTGQDRLYEKVRCEKRLLEDKYRCLKEKYVRLKNDVKISLERRNRRREQQTSITTTGSETERTPSNNRSSNGDEKQQGSVTIEYGKPPMGIVSSAKQKLRLENENDERPTQKHLKFIQQQDETSISQSDTTISNNHNRRQHLNIPNTMFSGENGNSDSEAFVQSAPKTSHERYSSSNNNNNNFPTIGRQKRKIFTRSKSASTSRLHSSLSQDQPDRPCTPVENLRIQLQKLEDLEDQFPENTMDTPYKLRYPFSDSGNQGNQGNSGELEFIKHRIHLEKDSVRRAKESLRTQRTNFRAKQREIKQRHASAMARHTMDQLFLEEKELTEMEVSLHRTRALLGEKVIRLRHLEHSLQRVYEKEKPLDLQNEENKLNRKEDATLSDVSSHSSSGFSSTDMHTDTIQGQRKDLFQESSEIMQSLENLNAEIPGSPTTTVPSLQDRLETYRHITGRNTNPFLTSATSVANTIVSQAPLAAHYTSSLVERTRDLRNWLKQAKTENEILSTNRGQQTTI